MDIRTTGSEVRTKLCKPFGNSAHVIIPKHWEGKEVTVILLDKKEVNKE